MSDAGEALSKVLGQGSAHEGAHHWRVQRLTAIAVLLLGIWFTVSLLLLPDFSYAAVKAWASGLANAALLALLVAAACWHSQLGVQIVIEDYVHGWLRPASLVLSAFLHVLLAVFGVLAIVRIALGN
jgi:succinate dehydrogenase / fumarate reductase, membrane anchor subunit